MEKLNELYTEAIKKMAEINNRNIILDISNEINSCPKCGTNINYIRITPSGVIHMCPTCMCGTINDEYEIELINIDDVNRINI